MAEQSIQISGAPVITSLNGDFYLSNPDATGYERIWRNKGPSAIYYQSADPYDFDVKEGWKLADIITGTVYFSEETNAASDPWDAVWTSTAYADHLSTLRVTLSNAKRVIEKKPTTVSVDVLEYRFTPDTTFHATKDYYYKPIKEVETYYLVRKIVAGNKIDPDTFYDDSGNITTDQFFVSPKQYWTCVDGFMIPAVYIESEIQKTIETNEVTHKKEIKACDFYNQVGRTTTIESSTIDNLTGTIITGSTHTTTDIKEIEIDVHKRYCAPKIEVGQVYRFAFIKDFRYLGYLPPSKLDFELEGRYSDGSEDPYIDEKGENDSDITKGIFRVENITTYYNLVLSGVDVYQNLYLPLNLSKELYEADRKKWMNDDVWYKLVDPSLPTRVYYVPVGIIDGIPDGNVTEYNRYHLIVDIGIFSDPDLLAELVTDINMLMRAKFGIPSSTQLASYDTLYIPDEYYDLLNRTRNAYIANFMSKNRDQYYNTLFYDEYNNLHQTNMELQGKVESYENLLKEVSGNG